MSIVRSPKSQPQHSVSELPRCRRQSVIDTAKSAGFLNDENGRITGRVRESLIKSAKERIGIFFDTELLEYALAKVALEDDFGPKILARKGCVSKDLDLEF